MRSPKLVTLIFDQTNSRGNAISPGLSGKDLIPFSLVVSRERRDEIRGADRCVVIIEYSDSVKIAEADVVRDAGDSFSSVLYSAGELGVIRVDQYGEMNLKSLIATPKHSVDGINVIDLLWKVRMQCYVR